MRAGALSDLFPAPFQIVPGTEQVLKSFFKNRYIINEQINEATEDKAGHK